MWLHAQHQFGVQVFPKDYLGIQILKTKQHFCHKPVEFNLI